MPTPMPNVIRAALVQTRWTGDKATMIDAHETYAREAAAGGAKVVCFQELFYGPYFCQVQDAAYYAYAESIPGPTTERFAALASSTLAAVAGIVFSILLTSSLLLLRLSIPTDSLVVGDWLKTGFKRVSLALNLVPFAGVAFLWLLVVLRDRLGAREDNFFATVFLGSGLLFLGMLFVAAATVGGLVGAE